MPGEALPGEIGATLAAARRGPAGRGVSPGRLLLRRFARHHVAVVSGLLLVLLALLSFAASLAAAWLGHDPNLVDLFNRFAPASASHPLGTDELGRDLLLRLLYGGRVSLFVGLVGALAAAVIGTVVGLIAGYVGGRTDAFLMRLTDAVIALPLLPLLIVLAAVDLGKLGVPPAIAQSEAVSLYRILLIVALAGWTTVARLVRGTTLSVRERDFVRAAVAQGAGPLRIMLRHVLPNVVSPIIVATTLSVGNVILTESVLSFLGLGIQPPLPSWGNMLTKAQELIWQAPGLAFWPGALIFATVIACNFLGDGLQDAMDPRASEP
jgi:peptide/nickel transport system permease protein